MSIEKISFLLIIFGVMLLGVIIGTICLGIVLQLIKLLIDKYGHKKYDLIRPENKLTNYKF